MKSDENMFAWNPAPQMHENVSAYLVVQQSALSANFIESYLRSSTSAIWSILIIIVIIWKFSKLSD